MTDDFAAPPPAYGTPAPPPQPRVDYRPAPKPPRRRAGRWLWWVMGVGVLAIVAGSVWAFMLDQRANNLLPADPGTTGRLHSAQVVSGMCLEALGDRAGSVTAVDCAEPHGAEVVTSYRFPGDAWPGDENAATSALAYCAGQLAPGAPLAEAAEGRTWVAWVPSEATWDAGDRTALCIVTADEPWSGRAGATEVGEGV